MDMLNIINRRFANVHIIINPVLFRGEGAGIEIARAIEEMNEFEDIDVLIVGRGGGSLKTSGHLMKRLLQGQYITQGYL